jgi:hypothetical protein
MSSLPKGESMGTKLIELFVIRVVERRNMIMAELFANRVVKRRNMIMSI